MRLASQFSLLVLCVPCVLVGCAGADAPSPETTAATEGAPAVAAQTASDTMGSLTHNRYTMDVKSVVVVWDEEERQLSFELLPFEPTPEDIERCRTGETFFMTVQKNGDPGLDARQFPDRVPYASYEVNWMDGAAGETEPDFSSLHAHFIAGNGTNLSLNFPRSMMPFELQGTVAEGETVRLIAQGEDDMGDDSLRWNLNLSGKVYTAL